MSSGTLPSWAPSRDEAAVAAGSGSASAVGGASASSTSWASEVDDERRRREGAGGIGAAQGSRAMPRVKGKAEWPARRTWICEGSERQWALSQSDELESEREREETHSRRPAKAVPGHDHRALEPDPALPPLEPPPELVPLALADAPVLARDGGALADVESPQVVQEGRDLGEAEGELGRRAELERGLRAGAVRPAAGSVERM